MTALIQVLGLVFGVLLISVGMMECSFIRDQRRHRFFLTEPDGIETLWRGTLNFGFYNVIWGTGAIAGALLLGGADDSAGQSVLLFTCVAHVVLGLILYLSERRLWGSALAEAVLPLVITVLVLA